VAAQLSESLQELYSVTRSVIMQRN
jgi:hypothetical protein